MKNYNDNTVVDFYHRLVNYDWKLALLTAWLWIFIIILAFLVVQWYKHRERQQKHQIMEIIDREEAKEENSEIYFNKK